MTLLEAVTNYGDLPDPCVNGTVLDLQIQCTLDGWQVILGAAEAGGPIFTRTPCGGDSATNQHDVMIRAMDAGMKPDAVIAAFAAKK